MQRIYHLHIPRTSGRVVCDALYRTFGKNRILPDSGDGDNQSLMYDGDALKDRPFVSGHYAKNPIVESNEMFDVFSIVRDPVQHYVSVASYVSARSESKMSNEFMDEFLYGYVTPFGANELFSNSGNLQAKMLFCRIALADESVVSLRDQDVPNNQNIIFIESDIPSETEIKNQIQEMNIFTLANRRKAVEWLDKKIFSDYGFGIDDSVNAVSNCSEMNGFTPDIGHIREILRRSEIDQYVYRLVNEKRDVILS